MRSSMENACDFDGLLVNNDDPAPDFVEVHIYGEIHRRAIACLTIVNPTGPEAVLVESVAADLERLGVEVRRVEK